MTTKPHRIHKLSGLLSVSRRRGSETQQCAWTTLGILGKAAHTLFICFLQLGSAQDVVYLMCVCQCREPPSAAIPTECVCVSVHGQECSSEGGGQCHYVTPAQHTHTHTCSVLFVSRTVHRVLLLLLIQCHNPDVKQAGKKCLPWINNVSEPQRCVHPHQICQSKQTDRSDVEELRNVEACGVFMSVAIFRIISGAVTDSLLGPEISYVSAYISHHPLVALTSV